MKILFFIFIFLLAAIGLGFLIHQDPGYAMVSYRHWVIATNIWVAGATTLLAFFLFYFCLRIAAIPKALARRKRCLNAKRYHRCMALGISLLASGDNKKAQRCFLKLKKRGLLSETEFDQLKKVSGML